MKAVSIRLSSLFAVIALAAVVYADAPAPNRGQANYEVRFLTMMIDHHNMAVMMAMLCEGRTVHPDLQQMCDDIINSQSAEIAEMQGWLRDWYDREHEPQMKPSDQRMLNRLASLSGEEFEIAFMTAMIKHHSIAVALVRVSVRSALFTRNSSRSAR